MSKHRRIVLSEEDRLELEGLLRRGHAAARSQTRARILLLSDRSQGIERADALVAEATLTSPGTVVRLRKRFCESGLQAAIYDRPRPGRAPKITGELEAKLTVLACSAPPEGRKRWTLHLLADQMVSLGYVDSISHVAVYKRLKKTSLSPGR